jgi:hypothetical protein
MSKSISTLSLRTSAYSSSWRSAHSSQTAKLDDPVKRPGFWENGTGFGGLGLPVALGLSLIMSSPVRADDLLQDGGSWLQMVGEGSLKSVDPSLEKGRIWLEGQARFNDDWKHWYQGMARAALGYSWSDRLTFWAGYTWIPTQNLGKPYISQQDVWPALRYVLPTDCGSFTFRTMVETNFTRRESKRLAPIAIQT